MRMRWKALALGGQPAAFVDALYGGANQLRDLARGGTGLLRQFAHFVGHDREAQAVLASACRFDGRIALANGSGWRSGRWSRRSR